MGPMTRYEVTVDIQERLRGYPEGLSFTAVTAAASEARALSNVCFRVGCMEIHDTLKAYSLDGSGRVAIREPGERPVQEGAVQMALF